MCHDRQPRPLRFALLPKLVVALGATVGILASVTGPRSDDLKLNNALLSTAIAAALDPVGCEPFYGASGDPATGMPYLPWAGVEECSHAVSIDGSMRRHADAALPAKEYMIPAAIAPAWLGGMANGPAAIPALLRIPPDWREGDPAAVLLTERSWLEPWRAILADELLAAGTAVLDLDIYSARGEAADNDTVHPPLSPDDLLPDVFGALRFLQGRAERAGPVLAFGRGTGGVAALLATEEGVATRYLGAGGPRFTAAARLDDGCEAITVRTGKHADAPRLTAQPVIAHHPLAAVHHFDPGGAADLACAVALLPSAPRRGQTSP